MTKRKASVIGCALWMALCLGISHNVAQAKTCPGRVIKMIIANPAGGVGDLVGRVLGEKASEDLGQPVVIENRAGATTVIGTDFVAKAPPDGCTILNLTASGVVISVLRNNLPYSLARDFTPILGIGSFPMVMAVPGSSNLKTFADLTAAIKSKGGITYGSGGSGSLAHLVTVRLIRELGGSGIHVPYRGNPDAMQGLMRSDVQLFFPSSAEALAHAKAGKIRLLGITTELRLRTLPNVPTMKELGFADLNPRLWYALLAPANTPAQTLARMRDAFSKAILDPSMQERLSSLGFTPEIKDPASVSEFMESEAARWGKVIKEHGIKASE